MEGASPPAPLGGGVPRPADAVAERPRDSRGLPAGAEPTAGCRWSSRVSATRRRRPKTSSTSKPDTGSRSGRRRRLTSRDSSAATTTCGRRKWRRPSSSSSRHRKSSSRHAVRQPARGDDARPRSRGPLDAAPGLAPRRQLHGVPSHAAPGGRESGSRRRRRRRERAAHAVAGAFGVRAGRARDARRRGLPRRSGSSSCRSTPTRAPTSAPSGGSPAGCRPWRSARTSSTRRTPSSPARLAAAGDAGPAQRQRAAAMDVPMMFILAFVPAGSASRASRSPARSSTAPGIAAGDGSRGGAGRRGQRRRFSSTSPSSPSGRRCPSGAPIVICVVGDERIAAALAETVRGQNISGHRARSLAAAGQRHVADLPPAVHRRRRDCGDRPAGLDAIRRCRF